MAQIQFGDELENVITRDEWPLQKARECMASETIAILGYGVQGPGQALNAVSENSRAQLSALLEEFGGHVLSYDEGHGTLELIGNGPEIDRFMKDLARLAEVESVARSGALAVAKGSPIFDAPPRD